MKSQMRDKTGMNPGHKVFSSIVSRARKIGPVPTAVAWPLSDVSLRGAIEAAEEGLIEPIMVGSKQELIELATKLELDISKFEIVEVSNDLQAAATSVALCRTGKAEVLMKGSLHTDHLMHAVMDDATGLKTHRRISHVFVLDVPSYPRMLLITDAAINIYPDLRDKQDIVQNAIDLAHVLGVAEPKVAILSAVETVTPKIVSTIDAAALCKMADRGQITGGLLDGPLAFDNAVNLKAAKIKHIRSAVAGKADVLVVPDLESGNMLAKQLEYLADSKAAGIAVGARVPIVLTSRADDSKTRIASCAIAVLLAHDSRKTGGLVAISGIQND
jgi:phosphate acetyltransferase